jgi:hypothetical protein
MPLTITGPRAALKWGYRQIATLGRWSFEGSGKEGTLTAVLTDCDEMGIAQSPLVVVVPAGSRTWRWPVRELRREGGTVTLTVTPVE